MYILELQVISLPAMVGHQRDKWTAACLDEVTSHVHNGTWKLTELPDGTNPIGICFVLKIKRIEDDVSVERYKARLVAQGFLHASPPGYKTYSAEGM